MHNSTQQPLHVICFGMGAIGTYIGGSLAAHGAQVTFIERPESLAHGKPDFLRVKLPEREIIVRDFQIVTDVRDALHNEVAQVALLAVKSFDTLTVLKSLKGLEEKFPPILCLQNGVENEMLIEERLGKNKIIAGTITSAVGRNGLGDVRLERLRGVGIESVHPLASLLIEGFNQAGLKAKGYPRRADMKWSKMLTNLMANATSAILNWTPAQVYSYPLTWKIELAQLNEALAVMRVLGIHLTDLPGTPLVALMSLLRGLPAGVSQKMIGTPLAKGRGAKMPSFHIDLYAGKTVSEVRYLNGAVAHFAHQAGMDAPVNDRLTSLLEDIAAGKIAKSEYADQPKKLAGELGIPA